MMANVTSRQFSALARTGSRVALGFSPESSGVAVASGVTVARGFRPASGAGVARGFRSTSGVAVARGFSRASSAVRANACSSCGDNRGVFPTSVSLVALGSGRASVRAASVSAVAGACAGRLTPKPRVSAMTPTATQAESATATQP